MPWCNDKTLSFFSYFVLLYYLYYSLNEILQISKLFFQKTESRPRWSPERGPWPATCSPWTSLSFRVFRIWPQNFRLRDEFLPKSQIRFRTWPSKGWRLTSRKTRTQKRLELIRHHLERYLQYQAIVRFFIIQLNLFDLINLFFLQCLNQLIILMISKIPI